MDNRQIARHFDLLAKLMELHRENPFKVRSYANAYQRIRRMEKPLAEMQEEDLQSLDGIGKTLAAKIRELVDRGSIKALNELKEKTPPGLLDMLNIKGLGPNKIRVIWEELGLTSISDLEYACLENRLILLKGFGRKTQENVLEQIAFLKRSMGKVLLPQALSIAEELLAILRPAFPGHPFEITGALRRHLEVIDQVEIIGTVSQEHVLKKLGETAFFAMEGSKYTFQELPFVYHETDESGFYARWYMTTGPSSFTEDLPAGTYSSEMQIFQSLKMNWVPPECRDLPGIRQNNSFDPANLVKREDIKGLIHAHSSWSDGVSSIRDMAKAAAQNGYEYLVLTDHSVSAFYANGLSEERVFAQWDEISSVNEQLDGFTIFRGIESDILHNGELDYRDDVLTGFELVIASIHSGLNMDLDRSMLRLIRAIEHPATRILGHPTGRLLLGRPGYPVDHKKIIDACAQNGVVIEINSNPYRLDLDWRWLPYAVERGVKIAISPDAHNIPGIRDTGYGVMMARKGGLTASQVINTLDRFQFEAWLREK